MIRLGIAEGRGHTTLRRNGVRTGRENFRDDGGLQTGLRQGHRSAHTGTTGTDDHCIKRTLGDFQLQPPQNLGCPTGITQQQECDDRMQSQTHIDGLDV